jgi:hypothetical protein
MAPEAAMARRQRWMAEPPAVTSSITPPASDGDSDIEGHSRSSRGRRGDGWGGHDNYLLSRQLKVGCRD